MPPVLKAKRFPVPIKGWNTLTPARELSGEYARALENVWFSQRNSMNRRPCQEHADTLATPTRPFGIGSTTGTAFGSTIFTNDTVVTPPYTHVLGELIVITTAGLEQTRRVIAVAGNTVTVDLPFNPSIPAGTTYFNIYPPTEKIGAIIEYKGRTGAQELFMWSSATGILYKRGATSYVSTGQTFTNRPRASQMDDILLVADGNSVPKTYNGTAWASLSVLPTAPASSTLGDIVLTHKARCYSAGDPLHKLTVHYSNVAAGNGTSTATGIINWSSATSTTSVTGGFLNLEGILESGDTITGLTTHQGMLVVLCANNIVFYSGDDPQSTSSPFVVHKVIKGLGCVTQDSIRSIGNDVIFLSNYGFKKLSQVLVQGDAAAFEASTPINNFVVDQLSTGGASIATIRSTYIEKYGLYVCTLSTGISVVYHAFFDSWTKWLNILPEIFTDSNGNAYTADYFLQTLSSANTTDKMNGNDTGITADMRWETAPVRAFTPNNSTMWRFVEIVYEAPTNEVIGLKVWKDLIVDGQPAPQYTLTPNTLIQSASSAKWGGLGTGARWYDPATPVATSKWVGQVNFFSGDTRIPIALRSELVSAEVTNRSANEFHITAIEFYGIDGNLRR